MSEKRLSQIYERWRRGRARAVVPPGFADEVMARASAGRATPSPRTFSVLRAGLATAASLVFLARLFAFAWLFLV